MRILGYIDGALKNPELYNDLNDQVSLVVISFIILALLLFAKLISLKRVRTQ